MIRERPERLQSVEAVQVLLFTGGVFGGGVAAVYVRLLLCGSIAAFYVWCTPDMRFCCGVLHLVHVRYTALLRCFVFGVRPICGSVAAFCVRSRLLFAACAPNRTACGMFRSYSAVGRDRHSCVLGCRVVIELGWFTSGLRVSLWRSRRRTKGRGERSRRRGVSALLRKHIGFAAFSAGSTLGQKVEAALRPRPRLRQRAIGSLDSLHLGRDVGAFHAAKDTRV